MVPEITTAITDLRAALRLRPHLKVLERPAPDEVTGERVVLVEDLDEQGETLGRMQVAFRWVSGTALGRGFLQVKLTDPFGLRRPAVWRKMPTPIDDIALTIDEWVVGIRATLAHRRALQSAENAVQARISRVSQRLGQHSLKTHRKSPAEILCEVIFRPKSLEAAARFIERLTPDERLRMRPAIWVRLDLLTPDRLEALVAEADAELKPPRENPFSRFHRRKNRA